MKSLISRLQRYTTTKDVRGSHPLSLFLRQKIERFDVRQLLGINLASLTFATAIVWPQLSEITSGIEVIRETQQTTVEVVPTQTKLKWPMIRFELSAGFSLSHPGVDLTDPKGTAVFPIAPGTVSWTKSVPWGYGKHLLVDHHDGMASLYAHLSSFNVKTGQAVSAATQIGEVGATGWATGNHLHLEIYQQGVPTNPLEVLPEIEAQRVESPRIL